jgi:rubrerythrin
MTKKEAIIFLRGELENVSGPFSSEYEQDAQEAYSMAISALVNKKEKRASGHWILKKKTVWDNALFECSNCKATLSNSEFFTYCPYCGAEMEVEE